MVGLGWWRSHGRWPLAALAALIIKAHSKVWGAVMFWSGNACLLFSMYTRGDGFSEEGIGVLAWLSYLALLIIVMVCKKAEANEPASSGRAAAGKDRGHLENSGQKDEESCDMNMGFDIVDKKTMTTMYSTGGSGKMLV